MAWLKKNQKNLNKSTVSINNIIENYYSKTWNKDIQSITDKQNNAQDVKPIIEALTMDNKIK